MTLAWIAAGIAAFLAPQVALLATTAQPPVAIEDPGWFLNAGRNVLVITSVIALAAAALAARRRWTIEDTAMFGLGTVMAMVGTLVVIGPGNLFPIVIVIGAFGLGFAVLAGTAIGYLVQLAAARLEPSRR